MSEIGESNFDEVSDNGVVHYLRAIDENCNGAYLGVPDPKVDSQRCDYILFCSLQVKTQILKTHIWFPVSRGSLPSPKLTF